MTSHTALRSRFVHLLPAPAGRVSLATGEAVLCGWIVEEVLSGAIAHQFEMNEARAVATQRAVLIYRYDFVQGQADGSVVNSSPL